MGELIHDPEHVGRFKAFCLIAVGTFVVYILIKSVIVGFSPNLFVLAAYSGEAFVPILLGAPDALVWNVLL